MVQGCSVGDGSMMVEFWSPEPLYKLDGHGVAPVNPALQRRRPGVPGTGRPAGVATALGPVRSTSVSKIQRCRETPRCKALLSTFVYAHTCKHISHMHTITDKKIDERT